MLRRGSLAALVALCGCRIGLDAFVFSSDARVDRSDTNDVTDAAPDTQDAAPDTADAPDDVPIDAADASDERVDAAEDLACGVGLRRCGPACVNVQDDITNCGGCGRACRVDQVCTSGVCECAAGRAECDGTCRNVMTDASHCGRCGVACATGACAGGVCVCPAGQLECAGACRSVMTDATHCGRCGVVCTSGRCTGGVCEPEQRSCAAAGTPGCGLVEITGGTFTMGSETMCDLAPSDPACGYICSPPQPMVTVSNFAMDAYEVTVARFRAFWSVRDAELAAIHSRPIVYPNGTSIPWAMMADEPILTLVMADCNWSRAPSVREAHPINCVGWWIAQEFCAWDGGRLPTEAEWEFTARGRPVPTEGLLSGRIYPWGDLPPSPSCDRLHWHDCPGEDEASTRRVGRFTATGGVFDLSGNVEEWVADWFSGYSTIGCWNLPAQRDPVCNFMVFGARVYRGGGWHTPSYELIRPVSRLQSTTSTAYGALGFRCVRTRR